MSGDPPATLEIQLADALAEAEEWRLRFLELQRRIEHGDFGPDFTPVR